MIMKYEIIFYSIKAVEKLFFEAKRFLWFYICSSVKCVTEVFLIEENFLHRCGDW